MEVQALRCDVMRHFLLQCAMLCCCHLNICPSPQAEDDVNGEPAETVTKAAEQNVYEVFERTLEKHFVTVKR